MKIDELLEILQPTILAFFKENLVSIASHCIVALTFYLLGRNLFHTHKLESLIQRLNKSTQKESGILDRISTRKRIYYFAEYGCFFVLAFSLALGWLYRQKMVVAVTRFKEEPKSQTLLIMYALASALFFLILLKSFSSWAVKKLELQLDGERFNKTAFMESFFAYIGEPVKKLIAAELLEGSKIEKSESTEQLHKAKLMISRLQPELDSLTKQNRLYKELVKQVVAFPWCDACYSGESQPQTANKAIASSESSQESTQVKSCEHNCLTKFFQVCEVLAKKMPKELIEALH